MKILMITPYLPYPLYSGGQIRTYHLLRALAKKHDITLFSFIRHQSERNHIQHLQKFCKNVVVFKRRKAWSLTNILFAGFSPFPFLVCIYYSFTLRQAIVEALAGGEYDLIHAETFYVMPNIPMTTVPILLVEQTIEFQVYQHFVERVPWWILRPLFYFDVWKIQLWEKQSWQRAERIVAMSESDRRVMRQVVASKDVDIIPNGVDLDFFRLRPWRPTGEIVLFVGNFNWLQNREAVMYLVRNVWPSIKRCVPDATLLIAGRNPSPEILGLTRDGILVQGNVEDIRTVYRAAGVLVASMLGRGGTRYKILEAMATGVPVVATKIGIEGINAVDGQDVFIRNHPKKMAAAVAELFKNAKQYRRIAENARQLIEKRYSWKIIAIQLDALYQKVGQA